jgi:hypothetical protein
MCQQDNVPGGPDQAVHWICIATPASVHYGCTAVRPEQAIHLVCTVLCGCPQLLLQHACQLGNLLSAGVVGAVVATVQAYWSSCRCMG